MSEDIEVIFPITEKLPELYVKPMGGGEWLCNGGNVLWEYCGNHGDMIGQLIVREDGVVVFRRITKL